MRRIARHAIVQVLAQISVHGRSTAAVIAERTGLNIATVRSAIVELQAFGILRVDGLAAESGKAGRVPQIYQITGQASETLDAIEDAMPRGSDPDGTEAAAELLDAIDRRSHPCI